MKNKIIVFFLISIVLCLPLTSAQPEGEGTLEERTFFSKTLNLERNYNIYLPKNYGSGKRYPVLYLLHGFIGDHNDWPTQGEIKTTLDSMINQGKIQELIVVMPHCSGSSKLNFICDETTENYLLIDLIQHTDSSYNTIPQRSSRAIGGLSMGASESMRLTFYHPDVFGSVNGHSGRYSEVKEGLSSNAITTSSLNGLKIYFDHGRYDYDTPSHYVTLSRNLDELLTQKNIPHTYKEYGSGPIDGGHFWTYWKEHIKDALLFHFPKPIEKGAEIPQSNPEPEIFVHDNARIFRNWAKINEALLEINKRLNVKFIIETGSIDQEIRQTSLAAMYLEQSTFAKRKFSTYGLDDRFDPTGTPALNLLIYFDPKFKGVVIDSENCGYKDDAIQIASNNRAVSQELDAKNYDDAFLILINELARLAEQRLSEGIDCLPDFENENPKADELVLVSTFAQFDPNFELARLRMAEAARALAQDLQQNGKISNAGTVVHEFNLQTKKALHSRELRREVRNLEIKLDEIRNNEYRLTETPVFEYYEDESKEEDLKKELEGVKFVLACLEKDLTVAEIQSNPDSCIDQSIIDKIGSFFTPVLFASGQESARTYARFSQEAFKKNVALNMLLHLEQTTGEAPADRLCAAYASAAASLQTRGLRFRAAEAYTHAQIYCKGVSNERYKSIPADSVQIIAEIERGNAVDAVWGTAKGISSPINVAVIGGTIILTVAAPPIGGALAGARGAAIAQEVVVGSKIAAGTYFTSTLAYSASENLGLCIGLGISDSKDCVAALTEAGMAFMIAKSGPKHIRDLQTADSLRVQVESLETRMKELDTLNLEGKGDFEAIRTEIARIEVQLDIYRRFLSNPNALALADQLKKQSKESDIRTIIDEIADQIVVHTAKRQASSVLQLTVSKESADALTFVEEIKKADGRITKEQALLPATQTQRLFKKGQPADMPAAPEQKLFNPKPEIIVSFNLISSYSESDAVILRKFARDQNLMEKITTKIFGGVKEKAFIHAKPLTHGGLKNVYKLGVSVEGLPTKYIVVKTPRYNYPITIEEFERTKVLAEHDLMPKLVTENPVYIDEKLVMVQEFVEGTTLKDIGENPSVKRPQAFKAAGELYGNLFAKTTTDGISATINKDASRRNIMVFAKGNEIVATFIEWDPRFEHHYQSVELFFEPLVHHPNPEIRSLLDTKSDTRFFLSGFVKPFSPEKALKLLERLRDTYANGPTDRRKAFSKEVSKIIAIIRQTGSTEINLAPTPE